MADYSPQLKRERGLDDNQTLNKNHSLTQSLNYYFESVLKENLFRVEEQAKLKFKEYSQQLKEEQANLVQSNDDYTPYKQQKIAAQILIRKKGCNDSDVVGLNDDRDKQFDQEKQNNLLKVQVEGVKKCKNKVISSALRGEIQIKDLIESLSTTHKEFIKNEMFRSFNQQKSINKNFTFSEGRGDDLNNYRETELSQEKTMKVSPQIKVQKLIRIQTEVQIKKSQ